MKKTKTIAGAAAIAVIIATLVAFASLPKSVAGAEEVENVEATMVAETTTTEPGKPVNENEVNITEEVTSVTTKKLSVNNAKVYVDNVSAPCELGAGEDAANEAAENAAYAAEKELTVAETTTSAIVVGEELEATAVAQATAKYVVFENNDTVKSVVSCGYPHNNFGLSDKEAKSITYAAIQYLCEGTEYTGEHVEEFNALVRAAQTYNGPYLLDGVTIIVR